MRISRGIQIAHFTYPGSVKRLFDTVVGQAQDAEASGFDSVFVMDHFYQLPPHGAEDEPMLEAYTTLGALTGMTERVALGALVTGNTYRNPALLAKTVTTLDVVSRGRAILGIGAGWFEAEHIGLGFEYGTISQRFERLDEALQIIVPMLRGERPSLSGQWYTVQEAVNEPRYRDTLPVMLGGSGERKTFRLAAAFADHMNIICPLEELPRKLAVLRARCEEIHRDPDTLATSYMASLIPVDNPAEIARARAEATEYMQGNALIGTVDQIAEELAEIVSTGAGGIIVNLPVNGHEPGRVREVGEALTRVGL